MEEFKRCVPVDIKTYLYLEEQKVGDVHRAATLADDYKLTHSTSGFHKDLMVKVPTKGSLSQGGDTSGTHFYWPGLRKDVADCCKVCHTCQMVGKPNQHPANAPLRPIPVVEEPFSRVLIDCVGPLPKTKSGNQYLLTIMCVATRFLKAIPLRNIKVHTIIKALIKFFTFVGFPKSIQSDQGSNFMSGVFQQMMHQLNITQYKSSAYHPQSQGTIERFHQTLKNMMRCYCLGFEKDWDEGVHLLMFAARESVQEALGFSPFELVFGH